MYTALLTVENIFGADHDVWTVNVEEEYHEAGSTGRDAPVLPRRTAETGPDLPCSPPLSATLTSNVEELEDIGRLIEHIPSSPILCDRRCDGVGVLARAQNHRRYEVRPGNELSVGLRVQPIWRRRRPDLAWNHRSTS